MKIGTPLSATATKALLLGSGELGKELVIALQRYGVEVIAVDRYDNAPAQQVAHRSHVLDMADAEAITKLIEQEQPNFIIPELEAIATDALAEIETASICKVIPNAQAAQLTMNREGIRLVADKHLKLPTSKYAFAETFDQLQDAVDRVTGYPCIIKPTMSSSGKGQSKIDSPAQLQPAWEYAKASARIDTGKVIVESVIDFDFEITLLTVRAFNPKGELQTYFCAPIGHRQEKGDYRESWQPQAMDAAALTKAQDIARKITDTLGGIGLFGVELFIQNDQVWFNEVSPRPHDTGMVTMVTQQQNQFELHARALLGLPIDTHLRKRGASVPILSPSDIKDPVYYGLDKALAVPDSEIRLFGKPAAYANRRMGVALSTAETVDEARIKAAFAANLIVIKPD